jgi:hypoxanthine phosphoribosyltransferase
MIEKTIPGEEIAARVAELGRQIRNDAGDTDLFILGILKGTSFFLADLMRQIDGKVGYGFIDVIRDVADTHTATALEIDFLSHIDIRGRHVYVLKDVVSTGVIENYLLTQLRDHKPASLSLVALLDRRDQRTVELEPEYRAFEVSEGTYVGYGLEFEGLWGNLPYIGRV